jgi:hypothetical protein
MRLLPCRVQTAQNEEGSDNTPYFQVPDSSSCWPSVGTPIHQILLLSGPVAFDQGVSCRCFCGVSFPLLSSFSLRRQIASWWGHGRWQAHNFSVLRFSVRSGHLPSRFLTPRPAIQSLESLESGSKEASPVARIGMIYYDDHQNDAPCAPCFPAARCAEGNLES